MITPRKASERIFAYQPMKKNALFILAWSRRSRGSAMKPTLKPGILPQSAGPMH